MKLLRSLTLTLTFWVLPSVAFAQTVPAAWSFWPWLDVHYLQVGAVMLAIGSLASVIAPLTSGAFNKILLGLASALPDMWGVLKTLLGMTAGAAPAAKRGFVGLSAMIGIVFFGFVAACAMLLTGCLPTSATGPVTPANAQNVADCQAIGNQHNALEVVDLVLTGSAASLGAIGALEPSTNAALKTDLAASAAATGGAAVLASALIGLTASSYASNQCSQYVGPLPAGPLPSHVQVAPTP